MLRKPVAPVSGGKIPNVRFYVFGVVFRLFVSQIGILMDLGCIFTLNCIPNGLFFEIWDVGAFDCDFKSRSGWFEILFTRPISQIAVIKFRFQGICDILEPRSYHKSQIFQNL